MGSCVTAALSWSHREQLPATTLTSGTQHNQQERLTQEQVALTRSLCLRLGQDLLLKMTKKSF